MLVENAGRLVTKQELLDAVWPETAVEENNSITTSRCCERRSEKATGQQYIETVPRVGYRFAADVEPRSRAPGPPWLRGEAPAGNRVLPTSDGIRLAYASIGSGPPLVKASNWLTHLDFEWGSPIWRHWWSALSLITASSVTTSAATACRSATCRT